MNVRICRVPLPPHGRSSGCAPGRGTRVGRGRLSTLRSDAKVETAISAYACTMIEYAEASTTNGAAVSPP